VIRDEQPADWAEVRRIHTAAFGRLAEAGLVDDLRVRARPLVSLVADDGDGPLGHILFSPVTLGSAPTLKTMGLAPLAVAPAHQGSGHGSALVRAGLGRGRGCGAVCVLGHPGYYPRFGFAPAAGRGIRCEYEVPPEAFMLIELVPGYLDGVGGTIRYHAAFAAVGTQDGAA
jgi:putative acetyltransferase